MKKIFGAESVAIGHPDKVADQISDAILDAYLAQDPKARVACETVVTPEQVVVAGEITSKASVDIEGVTRGVLREVGYGQGSFGIDANRCKVLTLLSKQSKDIAQAVDGKVDGKVEGKISHLGAGDQGIMVGYATDETDQFMPLPVVLAHAILDNLTNLRTSLRKEVAFLGPDAKSLVLVAYQDAVPVAIDSVVLSTQHTEAISVDELRSTLLQRLRAFLPARYLTEATQFFINPAGRFVIGGPKADTGMTGRKQMVDSYGAVIRHGGGAFSGKDPTKVDRSGAYLARYIAKNIVAAKLAKRCEVELTYVIGYPEPIKLQIDTFGTAKVPESALQDAIPKVFSLDVAGLIQMLDLQRPIYRKTAYGGHFGRSDPDFTWERCDKVSQLLSLLG